MTSKRSEVWVTGMTCGACVRRVQRALEATGGVHHVAIDLASGQVAIDHESDLGNADLVQAIEKSGYAVTPKGATT